MRPTITSPLMATGSGQRAHERVVVKVPGILRIPETRSGTYLITVLDASKMGLRISCPIAIAAGTRVEVKFGGATVMGTARYAREMDRDFNVGIEAHAIEDRLGVRTEEFDLTTLLNR
jgi:hypothetical protein